MFYKIFLQRYTLNVNPAKMRLLFLHTNMESVKIAKGGNDFMPKIFAVSLFFVNFVPSIRVCVLKLGYLVWSARTRLLLTVNLKTNI